MARTLEMDHPGQRRPLHQANETCGELDLNHPRAFRSSSLGEGLSSLLHDPDAGKALAILIFDNEDAYRKGDQALNAMPAADTPGSRASVGKAQVAVSAPDGDFRGRTVTFVKR